MAAEYILSAIHGEERFESKKEEFRHCFEKTDGKVRGIKIK